MCKQWGSIHFSAVLHPRRPQYARQRLRWCCCSLLLAWVIFREREADYFHWPCGGAKLAGVQWSEKSFKSNFSHLKTDCISACQRVYFRRKFFFLPEHFRHFCFGTMSQKKKLQRQASDKFKFYSHTWAAAWCTYTLNFLAQSNQSLLLCSLKFTNYTQKKIDKREILTTIDRSFMSHLVVGFDWKQSVWVIKILILSMKLTYKYIVFCLPKKRLPF